MKYLKLFESDYKEILFEESDNIRKGKIKIREKEITLILDLINPKKYGLVNNDYTLFIEKLKFELFFSKLEDDYYNISIFLGEKNTPKLLYNWRYYKCDQLNGLKKCILMLKKEYGI